MSKTPHFSSSVKVIVRGDSTDQGKTDSIQNSYNEDTKELPVDGEETASLSNSSKPVFVAFSSFEPKNLPYQLEKTKHSQSMGRLDMKKKKKLTIGRLPEVKMSERIGLYHKIPLPSQQQGA